VSNWMAEAGPAERLVLRLVSYGAYAGGVVGTASVLSMPWAGLVLVAAAVPPGAYLLTYSMTERSIRQDQRAHAPQSYQRPPDRSGPAAPEPLTMPPHAL
jgi:hypothetical protein